MNVSRCFICARKCRKTAFSRLLPLLLLTSIGIPTQSMAGLVGEHNKEPKTCQGIAGAAYAVNMLLSYAAPTPADKIAENLAFAANLNLRFCQPQIEAPEGIYGIEPDVGDQCVRTFYQPTTTAEYSNIMGIPNILTFPKNWGDLGTPEVYHFNTGVQVDLIGFDEISETKENFNYSFNNTGYVQLPVGRNQLAWRANTLASYLDYVPLHLLKFPAGSVPQKELVKKSSILQTLTQEGFKVVAKKHGKDIAKTITKKGVKYAVNKAFNLTVPHSAMGVFDDVYNTDTQSVWVYDRIPPEIETNTDNSSLDEALATVLNYDAASQTYTLEAFQPGGVLFSSALPVAEGLLSYSDACDTKLTLTHSSVPELWTVGDEVEVTWTVSDPGPVRAPEMERLTSIVDGKFLTIEYPKPGDDGGHNTAQVTQRFRVQDTNPPIVLAPPSKVVEVARGTTQTDVSLGNPRVFDLVDLDSEVTPDRSDTLFNLGLSEVTWTATDDAGNSSEAVQLINVKVEGTNSVPVAYSSTEAATSFKPIDIILTGADADYHASVNRYDPLTFSIVESPQNGFFIAPLLPFFIDDYRIEATALKFQDELPQADPVKYCESGAGYNQGYWQLEYPYLPEWMSVDDEGNTYVYDRGHSKCDVSNKLKREYRLVAFDPDGNFLRSRQADNNYKDISVDNLSGRLLTLNQIGAWDNYVRALVRNEDNFGVPIGETPAGLRVRDMQYARALVQDHQGVLYVQDSIGSIHAYRPDWGGYGTTQDGADVFLAQVPDVPRDPGAFDITVDSQNNLYAIHRSRIFKYSAGSFDGSGNYTPPQLMGWMGRCVGNKTDKVACDIKQQRSIGFSCSDDLCERAEPSVEFGNTLDAGDQPGQFRGIVSIAIDPHNILYVGDAGNKRVQRFTPEGYYAGQAKAQGQGYGFILGDFSGFDNISVNSDHFYLLQEKDPLGSDSGLLHVFKTTPITPIDDQLAKVTYQSNNNFQGADSFVFAATDGLDTDTARVNINVARDYRAPTIPRPPENQMLVEDGSVTITLTASDADEHLDLLSYEIVEAPSFGSVEVIGDQLIYTPTENYAGADSFSYRAFDGLYYSESATVGLTIANVADAPVVTLEAPENAGTGFYMPLSVTVYDPDEEADHWITIRWGDGSLDNNGAIMVDGVVVDSPMFNEDGTLPENIETTGPIYSIASNGYGNLNANHAYTQAGTYTVEVCASDKGTQTAAPLGCQQFTVKVEPRVAYRLTAQASLEEANPGDTVGFTFILENRVFDETHTDITTGLSDSNVIVSGEASSGLRDLRVPAMGTDCDINGNNYICKLDNVPYGSAHVIQLEAGVDRLAPGEALLSLNAQVGGTAPRHEEVTGAGQIKVIAKAVAPQLVSLTPDGGETDVGTPVTLIGNEFQAGAAVYFGNQLGQLVDVINSQRITVMAPRQTEGVVDVSIINPDERSDKLVEAFTYRAARTGDGSVSDGGGGGGGGAFHPLMLTLLAALTLLGRRRVSMC